MVGHEQWVEVNEVQAALKAAKAKVQEALKPGKVTGGSKDENMGVAYEFPNAKVYFQQYFLNYSCFGHLLLFI